MDDGVAFPADPEPPEVGQPGEGSFDDPGPAAQPGPVLGLAARDHRRYAAVPQRPAVRVVVIAAVSDHVVGALAWSAGLAGDVADPVHERQQLGDVVAVGPGVGSQQRETGGVAD